MKAVIEIYYCDFCGGKITGYPFSVDSPGLPNGHAYIDEHESYQTLVINNKQVAFCKSCCNIIKEAVGSGLVSVSNEFVDKMRYDAGYRKDGDKWIPVTLYQLKLEKGLIND